MSIPADLPFPFGRYRILQKIGQGGMGAVYLAEDTQLGRRVALKVPHFTPEDGPIVIERFHREARVAAAIEHPNICPVYDIGEVNGTHYLTMPFIDGTPLSQKVDGKVLLAPKVAVSLIYRIALAVGAMHERGVIHRDLKPGNILLRSNGEPVVMDFGLARSFGGQGRLTATGAVLGTPAYMSPEQIQGQQAELGPGTDIYSLGVMLFELLTGQLPFEGSLAAVYGQILHAAPPLPSQLRPGLDAQLEGICLKAMAKEPPQRYSSCKEFAAALRAWLKDAPRSDSAAQTSTETAKPPPRSDVPSPKKPAVPSVSPRQTTPPTGGLEGPDARSKTWQESTEVEQLRFVNRLRELSKLYEQVAHQNPNLPVTYSVFFGLGALCGVLLLVLVIISNRKEEPVFMLGFPAYAFAAIGLAVLVNDLKAKGLKKRIPPMIAAVVEEFPGRVRSIGGARALQDENTLVESLLVLVHGVDPVFLEHRRARKPAKTVAHKGHVVEVLEPRSGTPLRIFHDNNEMLVKTTAQGPSFVSQFDAHEDGKAIGYEIVWQKSPTRAIINKVTRDGFVLEGI
jgi:serine/threonine protein kinase